MQLLNYTIVIQKLPTIIAAETKEHFFLTIQSTNHIHRAIYCSSTQPNQLQQGKYLNLHELQLAPTASKRRTPRSGRARRTRSNSEKSRTENAAADRSNVRRNERGRREASPMGRLRRRLSPRKEGRESSPPPSCRPMRLPPLPRARALGDAAEESQFALSLRFQRERERGEGRRKREIAKLLLEDEMLVAFILFVRCLVIVILAAPYRVSAIFLKFGERKKILIPFLFRFWILWNFFFFSNK